MALAGKAAIAIWSKIDPGMLEEHDAWHSGEHLAERMALPGFLRGRRSVAMDAANAEQRFIFYEIESIATATSPAYLERLNNPTPWSRKIMAMHGLNRTLCRVAASEGLGVGAHLLTLRLSPRAGQAGSLQDWLVRDALLAIARAPGVVGAHLLQKDAGVVRPQTGEEKIRRGGVDASADWIVIVEAYAAPALEPVAQDALSAERIRERGGDREFAARYALAQVVSR